MSTSEGRDSRAKQIQAYTFLKVFADDDLISEGEFRMLERLALKDAVVDGREAEVFRRIFARVDLEKQSPTVQAQIAEFRDQHAV